MKRYLGFAITALLLLVLVLPGCSSTPDCPKPLGKAPNFTLQTLDGKTVSLKDYAGKRVVVNFWATWCDFCKAEMPYIQAIDNKYARSGLVVLAVSCGDNANQVKDFVVNTNLKLTVLLDPSQSVVYQYCIDALPLTLFIDPKGIIVDYQRGAFNDQSEIEARLKSFQ
jgi:peroxiredoxin